MLISKPFSKNLYFFIAAVLLLGLPDAFDYMPVSVASDQVGYIFSFSPVKFVVSMLQASLMAYLLCWVSSRLRCSPVFKVLVLAVCAVLCVGDWYCELTMKTHYNFMVRDLFAQSNPDEASEYMTHVLTSTDTWLAVAFAAGLLVAAWPLAAIARWLRRLLSARDVALLTADMLVLGSVAMVIGIVLPVTSLFVIPPVAESLPAKLLIARIKVEYNKPDYSRLEAANAAAVATAAPDRPELVVLVLGESYNKRHASIYGYRLPTTPQMQAEVDSGHMHVYTDVVACHNLTQQVMREVFSTQPYADEGVWDDYPLFLALFKKAGYKVHYYNNQASKLESYNITNYFRQQGIYDQCIDHGNFLLHTYDGEMLPEIASYAEAADHALVIFSLHGQHLRASKRYPPEFSKFGPQDYPDSLTQQQRSELAHYDNACLYNDWVIARLLDELRSRDAVMVYVSDHGEEIYDFRDQYGRVLGEISPEIARCIYEVPMVVWTSEAYRQRHPQAAERIARSVDRPFINADISQLMLELGAIESPWFVPSHSVINPDYTPPRRVLDLDYVYDQDQ